MNRSLPLAGETNFRLAIGREQRHAIDRCAWTFLGAGRQTDLAFPAAEWRDLNDLVATIEGALPGEVAPDRPPRLSGEPQLTLGMLVDVPQGFEQGNSNGETPELPHRVVSGRGTLNETVKAMHPVDHRPRVSEHDRRRWKPILKVGCQPSIDDIHRVH